MRSNVRTPNLVKFGSMAYIACVWHMIKNQAGTKTEALRLRRPNEPAATVTNVVEGRGRSRLGAGCRISCLKLAGSWDDFGYRRESLS